jgi:hypothetical protein
LAAPRAALKLRYYILLQSQPAHVLSQKVWVGLPAGNLTQLIFHPAPLR